MQTSANSSYIHTELSVRILDFVDSYTRYTFFARQDAKEFLELNFKLQFLLAIFHDDLKNDDLTDLLKKEIKIYIIQSSDGNIIYSFEPEKGITVQNLKVLEVPTYENFEKITKILISKLNEKGVLNIIQQNKPPFLYSCKGD
ncbi:hypothetical protein J3E07_001667 [Methanococcus voltae]|uniref:Uncharacterized protein n=1 Tax=Methanococcus voltae TaxID=2188 RepID=A0A8J7RJU7_METVO|nr:hypothetical protein [Methanococcus voltae]MBP2202226.1 hypothetical protein [Methanococcus voltae]